MTDQFIKYSDKPEETIIFDETIFTLLINSVNSCTEKYYAINFPDDKQDFTKCCTKEEKDIFKKCIQILQSESNFKSNNDKDTINVYLGLIQYYYSSIILEYYVLTETNDYKCFTELNKIYPGAVKVRDAITTSNDPWASKIRRLINFAVTTNYRDKLEEESSVNPEELKESNRKLEESEELQELSIKLEELKGPIRKPEELKVPIRKPEELKVPIRKPEESSLKPKETIIFNEKIFNLLNNAINDYTAKYYAINFPDDKQDFNKCCTEKEKDAFKKCVQIIQSESKFKLNNDTETINVYLALLKYYYTIILEYNDLPNYNYFILLIKKYPGTDDVLHEIFYSSDPWASKIQNLLDNAMVSGGYKKRILNRKKNLNKKKKTKKSVGKKRRTKKSVGKKRRTKKHKYKK